MRKTILVLLSFLFWGSLNDLTAQKLIDFKISPCKNECFVLADIISQVIINDTLNVEIGVNLNCCGAYIGEIQYNRDTLNLISKHKPNKKGVVIACDCNCYYNLKYKILNIKSLPKVILFNSETIEKNRSYAGWAELVDENFDSTEIADITMRLLAYNKAIISNYKFESMNPTFKKDLKGMTSLDFSKYINLLTFFSFSDSLIISEKSKYSKSIEGLSTIRYEDFLKLDSLEKQKRIECDLTKLQMLYRLQEKVEYFTVTNITIRLNSAIVLLKAFDDSQNEVIIEFQKISNRWKIIEINKNAA